MIPSFETSFGGFFRGREIEKAEPVVRPTREDASSERVSHRFCSFFTFISGEERV